MLVELQQQPTPDAVLCFAVHYNCLDVKYTSLGTLDLSQLSRVSHHCLDALRQQIAPTIFTQGACQYDSAPNAECFLSMMRFAQLCHQGTHLWGPSFMLGLQRFYLDTKLPAVACRLLLDALRRVRHQKNEKCGYYCAFCMLPPLITQIDQTNESGTALARVLVEQPCASLETVTRYYDNYMRDVTQLCAKLTIALQATGCGYNVRESLHQAMRDMCIGRIAQHEEEWLQCLVEATEDLYTLLVGAKESALYNDIQATASKAIGRMSRAELSGVIERFFALHVRSEEEWKTKPSEMCAKLLQMVRCNNEPPSTGRCISSLFRVHELRHLCALNEQYDTETLTRLVDLQISWRNKAAPDESVTAQNEEVVAVERLVAMLEQRDAQLALNRIFAPLPVKVPSILCMIAQQQARDTRGVIQAAMSSEALDQSCDPLDIFIYQGGPLVSNGDPQCFGVLSYLDAATPVVDSFDLPRLCEFLQEANAVFATRHWRHAIPLVMRQALARCYGISVCASVVSIAALHTLLRCSLPCLDQLRAVEAFGKPVEQWLETALQLFVREAQRRMYQSEWRCPCGREFTACVPEAMQLCEAVLGTAHILYVRVAELESDYVTTLMRQEYNMMTSDSQMWSGDEVSEYHDDDELSGDELYNYEEDDEEVEELV